MIRAITKNKILGYMIVKGSIKWLNFAAFLGELNDYLFWKQPRKLVCMIFDQAKCH